MVAITSSLAGGGRVQVPGIRSGVKGGGGAGSTQTTGSSEGIGQALGMLGTWLFQRSKDKDNRELLLQAGVPQETVDLLNSGQLGKMAETIGSNITAGLKQKGEDIASGGAGSNFMQLLRDAQTGTPDITPLNQGEGIPPTPIGQGLGRPREAGGELLRQRADIVGQPRRVTDASGLVVDPTDPALGHEVRTETEMTRFLEALGVVQRKDVYKEPMEEDKDPRLTREEAITEIREAAPWIKQSDAEEMVDKNIGDDPNYYKVEEDEEEYEEPTQFDQPQVDGEISLGKQQPIESTLPSWMPSGFEGEELPESRIGEPVPATEVIEGVKPERGLDAFMTAYQALNDQERGILGRDPFVKKILDQALSRSKDLQQVIQMQDEEGKPGIFALIDRESGETKKAFIRTVNGLETVKVPLTVQKNINVDTQKSARNALTNHMAVDAGKDLQLKLKYTKLLKRYNPNYLTTLNRYRLKLSKAFDGKFNFLGINPNEKFDSTADQRNFNAAVSFINEAKEIFIAHRIIATGGAFTEQEMEQLKTVYLDVDGQGPQAFLATVRGKNQRLGENIDGYVSFFKKLGPGVTIADLLQSQKDYIESIGVRSDAFNADLPLGTEAAMTNLDNYKVPQNK